MSVPSLVQDAVGWVGGYLAWLKDRLESDTARRAVLVDLGLDPEQVPPSPVANAPLDSITRYRQATDPDEQAFLAVWQDIVTVVEAVEAFVDVAGAGGKGTTKEVLRQFLAVTSTEYVRLRNPAVYFGARLVGVVEDIAPSGFHAPVDAVVSKHPWDNLVAALERPLDHLDRVFSSPETEEDARQLAAHTLIPFAMLLAYWELTVANGLHLVGAGFELPGRRILQGWDAVDGSTTPVADRLAGSMVSFLIRGLDLRRLGPGGTPVESELGATLAWVPREHGGPGLFVSVNGSADVDFGLGSRWTLNTKGIVPGFVDVLIWDSVDFGPESPAPSTALPAAPAARAVAAAAATGTPPQQLAFTIEPVTATAQEPKVLSVFGTRIEIGHLSITVVLGDNRAEVGVVARQSALVVPRRDGDGFVRSLLPDSGLRLAFDLGMRFGFTPEPHFALEGGSGLQATLPLDRAIGPARLQQLYLELAAGSKTTAGGLRLEASLAASVRLGPITASVERVGFELTVDTDGATAPHVGFKAPSGIGLVIDASIVTGGGYLYHDPAKQQYAGVVQLDFKGITLHAVGLLTTQLPGGREGYSLLVMISADFLPIDLGLGFRLTGVGGVLGYQRTVAVDALRAGLKQGVLDNVLFPGNPVRDAPRLVAALETLFPVQQDQWVAGPTARITWGVPVLVSVELAIILEFENPWRLVVLAQVRADLPRREAPVVVLRMDAIGVVDFDRNEISFDAVLFDSRFGRFPVTGDMAVRARYGDDPAFAMAIGGLHPKFDPPAGFPQLARVVVGLSQGGVTKMTLQAYLAITANTAQVGARLDVLFEAAGFSVAGSLSFDALFTFQPFSFLVDLQAKVTVKWHGTTLLGVTLDLTLSGPSPWRARGKATLELWWFSTSISFDRTIGDDVPPAELPAADPLPELVAALADPRNWSARPPDAVVTLRDAPPDGDVLLHPLGDLAVSQRVVPLGIDIDRFGSAAVAGDRRFDVAVVGPDGTARPTDVVEDHFAPGQFLDLSDAEKLQRPSFERMAAGVRIGSVAPTWGGQHDEELIADAALGYETVVMTPDGTERRDRGPFAATGDDLRAAAAFGAVARGTTRHTGAARYRTVRRVTGSTAPSWTVVDTVNLSAAPVPGLDGSSGSYTVARQALDRHVASNPELAGRLQVVDASEAR